MKIINLTICFLTYLYLSPAISLSIFIYIYIFLYLFLYLYLSFSIFICLYIYLFYVLFIYLSIFLSIFMYSSISLYIFLSLHLFDTYCFEDNYKSFHIFIYLFIYHWFGTISPPPPLPHIRKPIHNKPRYTRTNTIHTHPILSPELSLADPISHEGLGLTGRPNEPVKGVALLATVTSGTAD